MERERTIMLILDKPHIYQRGGHWIVLKCGRPLLDRRAMEWALWR